MEQRYSRWSIYGALAVGLSLPGPLLMILSLLIERGGYGPAKVLLALASVALPGLGGTLLGWLGLNKIHESRGRVKGLPLAMFAALFWPLTIPCVLTVVFASAFSRTLTASDAATGFQLIGCFLVVLLPAAVIAFSFWTIHATARWASHQPVAQRRGVLKWVFIAMLLLGMGAVLVTKPSRPTPALAEAEPDVTAYDTNTWVHLTFTAVELREVEGVRWLALDYLDQVNAGCEKSFPWESSIPDFKATTRTSEFLKDTEGSAPVRHQRIEYRLPASATRASLEALHAAVEKNWKHQSLVLHAGEQQELFKFFTPEDASLKAWVKAGLPTHSSTATPSASHPGASTEPWSPKLAPGEKPVPSEILQEAKSLAANGRYEDALQRQLWFHRHALEHDSAQSGVRLSFALSYWVELARRYPKAKAALLEVRDRGVAEFTGGGGYFELFMEVSAINGYFGQEDATLALFKSILSRDPKLARQCYWSVEDLLVEKGDYALCESFVPDFQQRFETIRSVRERTLQLADRTPAVNQTSLRKETQRTFIKDTRKLVEILVGVGRKTEAEEIRDQAVAVLNVPELQTALAEAEHRVANIAAAVPVFGRVQECMLPDSTAIDLFSGRLKTVPASLASQKITPEIDVAICDWIERQDLDIAYLGRGEFYNSVQDMKVLTREEWNDFSPAQLAASLHPIGKDVGGKFGDKVPFAYTYGFKTRAGRLGLLQIMDYSDKQGGVKIRYKLAGAMPASQP